MRALLLLPLVATGCDLSLAAPGRCLTHELVEPVLDQLRNAAVPTSSPDDARLVDQSCKKRVYVVGEARFVLWRTADGLRGKGSTTSAPLPSATCIERGLARARALVPFAGTILDRAAADDPALWRDPDVGVVSYLQCTEDVPALPSISTMLHEANHHLGRDACSYDFTAQRERCLDLPRTLPPGTIAAYREPPKGLDAVGRTAFESVQSLYLERNGQGLRELLDEVTSYRIDAELLAIKGFARPHMIELTNLPLMMSLVVRYLNVLERDHPGVARKVLGPGTKNRANILALLDAAEVSYRRYEGTGRAGRFEKTFWSEYQRGRAQWLDAR